MLLNDSKNVHVREYRESYRWLKSKCAEWNSYFTKDEKENRSPTVLSHITYLEQELKRFQTLVCSRANARDKEAAQGAIDQATQILAAWGECAPPDIDAVECSQLLLMTYVCESCWLEWDESNSCHCNDRCPNCNRETEPIETIVLSEGEGAE